MEAVIDTNVLIYDSIEDSAFHQVARGKLEKLDKCIIPTVVIEEFVFALRQLNIPDKFILKKISELLEMEKFEIVSVTKENIKSALAMISSEKISFKRFNDKIILSVGEKKKLSLLTFDLNLKKECKKHGVKAI